MVSSDVFRHFEDDVLENEVALLEESLDRNCAGIGRLDAEIATWHELSAELGDPHDPRNPWDPNDPRWQQRFEVAGEIQRLTIGRNFLEIAVANKTERLDETRRLLGLSFAERVAEARTCLLLEAQKILAEETRNRFGWPTESNLRRCWGLLRSSCQYGDLLIPLEEEHARPPAEILTALVNPTNPFDNY